MNPESADSVYQQIVTHIQNNGNVPSQWYVGIASNWQDRLFIDHAVPKTGHGYIARQCFNINDSRAVEQALLQLGCDGGPGGGDNSTVFVYAYIKALQITNP